MRQRGFTLVELMIATAMMALFFGATSGLVGDLYRSGRVATSYVDDLAQIRRAVHALEADLEGADEVTLRGAVVEVRRGTSRLSYQLMNGVLKRTKGSSVDVIARRIAVLRVTVRGSLVRLRLALKGRSPKASRVAFVDTALCLRRGGSR